MKRIVILGCAGCGKSTLAKELGAILNLPVIHLDRYYWKPGWVEESADVFQRFQQEVIREDEWIIDGNYRNSLDLRLSRCDTVIYLDFKRIVALRGIFKRYHQYKNKERDSIGVGCPERIDKSFFKWVWNFRKNARPILLNKVKEYPHINCMLFKNRRSLYKFVESLRKESN